MMNDSNTNINFVHEYLNGPFQKINGWCIPQLWNVIQPIHLMQEKLGCKRPIAEIGVFHGKFFIGLALTKKGYGKHYAIDVFDLQQFNLDQAGVGNKAKLTSNIQLAGLSSVEVEMFRADSMTLSAKDLDTIRDGSGGGFSMFSVDGCHLAEHTINDFRIAMQLTVPEGIIFVDDYLNMDWPGVHEGMVKLFMSDCPRFVPLAYLGNKLVLCHASYHDDYLKQLGDFLLVNFPAQRRKRVKRFGYDSINLHLDYAKGPFIKDFSAS